MQNKKFTILFVFALSLFFKFSQAQPTNTVLAYIARYKDLAIEEMKRTGIPASITLAQGIHETEAGTSELVRRSNNHFGIKCKDNWKGQSVSHDDDARGECFRKYAAPEESYRDHSDFLKTRPNYTSLFKLDPADYEAWAYGLKKAGYATNPKYAQILIKLIRDYNLQEYTLIALGKMKEEDRLVRTDKLTQEEKTEVIAVVNAKVDKKTELGPPALEVNYPSGEFKINSTRVIYARKGTSYLTIAQQYEIPLAKLFEFNDLKQQEVAEYDQLVFIQRKRKIGEHEFHIVQAGENLNNIAQAEAIRLESLLEYNSLGADMQPAVGETLYLRSKSPSMPKLATKNAMMASLNSNSQTVAINNARMEQKQAIQKNSFILHIVQPKETVYSIAKKYSVGADDVVSWNQLQDYDLKIGQSLKIYK
ncbi:MAG TPA: glucosaminidase domain-containing protein [Chitinophagaceae bacterium]|jgi:LysM repeat protein|nr:glucosaminidase domain-containing protein [Chitinophagaceae bacterium]